MSSSGLSDVSSPLSTDEELANAPIRPGSLEHFFKNAAGKPKQASPPAKRKRPPSPPHEYVLADNPDIAFVVMFRSRFSDAFPKSLPHYGPQDIERGIIETPPGEQVERLLCALIGLVLNRKKDVEKGHYVRALEEAIHAHAGQWPVAWQGKNPLHGGGSFNNMSPEQRLTLLKTLIIWSLSSSEPIQTILRESYKQQRHEDDLNQPLSVQPWGRDGDKRRFWLVEGQDDTHFRLYRESNPALKHNTWRSVAGTIDELKDVATKLGEEDTQASRRLRDRILAGVPRFEASEEKRKRRDYRNARKAQFTRTAELGFSLYEGRTRGKKIKYTFSDDEGAASDAISTRHSNRNSGISTPAEPARPTFTTSGRQVRSRYGGAYGEKSLRGQQTDGPQIATSSTEINGDEGQSATYGRGQRSAGHKLHTQTRNRALKSYDGTDEDSAASTSEEEWDGGDDDDDVDDQMVDASDEEEPDSSEDGLSAEDEDQLKGNDIRRNSLVVSLRYQRRGSHQPPQPGLDSERPPIANGAAASYSASGSDVQTQQTQQHLQNFNLQSNSPSQEGKPASQDLKTNAERVGGPGKEISHAPPSDVYSRHLAPPNDAAPVYHNLDSVS